MSYNGNPFKPRQTTAIVESALDIPNVDVQQAPKQPTNPDLPRTFGQAEYVLNSLRTLIENALPTEGVFRNLKVPKFWIAGGSLQCLITRTPVNDFDIFTDYPVLLKSMFDDIDSPRWRKGHSNKNFSNYYLDGVQIQLITRFAPESLEATISMFDFTIVSAAFDGKNFVAHPRYFMDVASKILVARDQDQPFPFVLSTLERVTKYAQRGYTLCPMLLKKIAKQIHQMDIDWDNPSEDTFTFYPDGTPRFVGVD